MRVFLYSLDTQERTAKQQGVALWSVRINPDHSTLVTGTVAGA